MSPNQRHRILPTRGEAGPVAQRPGRVGIRTCAGCREEAGKAGMIRIVRRAEGGAAIDHTGRATGRGAYVHDDPGCVELARKKRSLDRALHTTIQPELWSELTR
jgi:predicted RNA-binding protein YlxR (DUF448 family)